MIDPRDEMLLNDLLDGRLLPGDAEAARARVATEPDLREAWEDLHRLRAYLRAEPERAPPIDFVRRVRERIAVAGEAAPPGEATPVRPAGTLLRWTSFAYAAAAALVVALGAVWYLADRDRGPYAPPVTTAKERPSEGGRVSEYGDATTVERAVRTESADASASGRGASPSQPPVAGGTPPAEAPSSGAGAGFFGPGGTVPPGLRAPSDAPKPSASAPAEPALPRVVGFAGTASEPDSEAPAGPHAPPPVEVIVATYVFEAADLAEGRAELQVLVASLCPSETGVLNAKALDAREGKEKPDEVPTVDIRRLRRFTPASLEKAEGLAASPRDHPVPTLRPEPAPAAAPTPPPPTTPPQPSAPGAAPATSPDAVTPTPHAARDPDAGDTVLGSLVVYVTPEEAQRLEDLTRPATPSEKADGAEDAAAAKPVDKEEHGKAQPEKAERAKKTAREDEDKKSTATESRVAVRVYIVRRR